MASPRCPTCRHAAAPKAENKWYPFCGERCKAIDLGKWLGEEFKIASKSDDDDEDGAATATPRREDA